MTKRDDVLEKLMLAGLDQLQAATAAKVVVDALDSPSEAMIAAGQCAGGDVLDVWRAMLGAVDHAPNASRAGFGRGG